MKKIIFLLSISITLLFASNSSDELKLKILKNIISGIENSKPMTVWSDDEEIMSAFYLSKKFVVVDRYEDAKMIILSKKSNLPKRRRGKHIFVLDYNLLYEIPESIGAFFWKKGRPNIVFLKSRIEEQSLKLSANLKPYLEEKLW
ncbi:MAG: hypothetical protein U9Q29_00010 [Campylobacterota bacterium]|nr:hypothetical protein [Campylobacterota bacterium]